MNKSAERLNDWLKTRYECHSRNVNKRARPLFVNDWSKTRCTLAPTFPSVKKNGAAFVPLLRFRSATFLLISTALFSSLLRMYRMDSRSASRDVMKCSGERLRRASSEDFFT